MKIKEEVAAGEYDWEGRGDKEDVWGLAHFIISFQVTQAKRRTLSGSMNLTVQVSLFYTSYSIR
jgi:hypothetical protein